MFYKKQIDKLETELIVLKHKVAMNDNHKRNHDSEIQTILESIDITETGVETNTRLIEGHDKLLQQLIPTINKQTQKYKKLEENYQMLVKVVEKIVTKIDPEWKKTTAKKGK